MYAREYRDEKPILPAHYGGTAFVPEEEYAAEEKKDTRLVPPTESPASTPKEGTASPPPPKQEGNRNPWESPPVQEPPPKHENPWERQREDAGPKRSKNPFGLLGAFDLFGSGGERTFSQVMRLLGKGGSLFQRFHVEDFLICAIAFILLFSKNGDKECAILLLFLLFVN